MSKQSTEMNTGLAQRMLYAMLMSLVYSFGAVHATMAEEGQLDRFDVEPNVEDVRRCLQMFSPGEKEYAQTLLNIQSLGDTRFSVRQEASRALLRMSVLPLAELRQAAKSDNQEVVFRAKFILANRKSNNGQHILKAALDVVARNQLPGMASDVIKAVQHVQDDSLWTSVVEAIAATSSMEDRQMLVKTLHHERPVARAAAVAALSVILEKEVVQLIRKVLDDPDQRVALVAACRVGDYGDPACLATFARLLDSPQARVRLKAIESLRWLTNNDFGYYAGDTPDDRKEAVKKWEDWISKNGETAKLRYPSEVAGTIALFGDEDLEGWKLVVNSDVVDDNAAAEICQVNNGVVSFGVLPSGYLRTEREFLNYRLSLEYCWPKGAVNCDGGMQLLQTGPDLRKPNCLELQMHMGNAGDLYRSGDFKLEPGGKLRTGPGTRFAKSSEKAAGEWNRIDVEVRNGRLAVAINGVPQNLVTGCPSVPTRIAFLIERSSYKLRNVELLPLDE